MSCALLAPRRVEQRTLALCTCALVRALDGLDSVRFVFVLRIVLFIFWMMRTVGTCLNSDLCIYVLCDFRLSRRVEQRALALCALVRALDYLDSVRFVRVLCIVLLILWCCAVLTFLNYDLCFVLFSARLARRCESRAFFAARCSRTCLSRLFRCDLCSFV